MTLNAVGLLSPGDMGHVVGQVLVNNGMPVYTCLQDRSQRTRDLAKKAKIEEVQTYEALIGRTDMILSILVPAQAENAAEKVAQASRKTGEPIAYADCNAISPSTSQSINKILRDAGCKYIDVSIIGPPPRIEGRTRFYASGPDTEIFEELSRYGLDVRTLGDKIGKGKGIKMTYASLTKGLSALSLELLTAAHKMDLYDDLVREFQISQPMLLERMERGLLRTGYKARRFVGEMLEIASTYETLGMTEKIYHGAAEMYKFVGNTVLGEETPENYDKDRSLKELIKILADEI
jgi:3-hydroxyisobutyrate dehydrogenase-like beta-hydroxyacid dehydrogenase